MFATATRYSTAGPMQAFRITEREHESGWRELVVEGELDLAVADQLQAAIAASEARPILVDLGECEFIDSTGIAVLLLAKRAASADAPVLVHSARDQVQRVFAVTGLSDDGFLYPSGEAATSALLTQS